MRVLINRPTNYIELFDKTGSVELFYDKLLPRVLDKIGIEYGFLHTRGFHQEKDTIHLAWHLHGTLPNIWHLKDAYLQDYFYFDKNGYSGWSEIAQTYDYDIDVDVIRDDIQQFCDHYISHNKSKVSQPSEAFIPAQPYILVLNQRTNDAVSKFAYISNQLLLDYVTNVYKDSKYKVCVKNHPLAITGHGHTEKPITHSQDVFVATGSIHKIIAGASAVYTVNSGAGFEALLHGKRVFTSGHCDYHWATNVLKTAADVTRSKKLLEEPVDTDRIIKFLHYALHEHFINIHDEQTIEQKLRRAIREYDPS